VPVPLRSVAVIGAGSVAAALAFCWPLIIGAGSAPRIESPLLFVAVLPILVLVMLTEVAAGRLDARALAMLGVLSALGAAVRPLGAGTAGVETVFVLVVLGGRVFGAGFGFVLGSTTLLASALLTGGVGPWLPFQMLAASWVGLGAGLLPPIRGRVELPMLAGYSIVSSLAYGLAMNLSFWPYSVGLGTDVSYVAGAPLLENLQRFGVFTLVTSIGWDIGRAITTVVLLIVVGPGVLGALRRAGRRAAFADVSDRAPIGQRSHP
jgi:energy-coupling factor transport system substrate-specific component